MYLPDSETYVGTINMTAIAYGESGTGASYTYTVIEGSGPTYNTSYEIYQKLDVTGTTAKGKGSHAEGISTIASADGSHVQGRHNIEDTAKIYAHIVGNGTSTKPSNAHTIDWNGNAWFAGDVYVGVNNTKLVTMDDIVASGGDIQLDTTLTKSSYAADAKAVGEALNNKISKTGSEIIAGSYGQGGSTGAIPQITVNEDGIITEITTSNLNLASTKINGLMDSAMYNYIYNDTHAACAYTSGTYSSSITTPMSIRCNSCAYMSINSNVKFPKIYGCFIYSNTEQKWFPIQPTNFYCSTSATSAYVQLDPANAPLSDGDNYTAIVLYERTYVYTNVM